MTNEKKTVLGWAVQPEEQMWNEPTAHSPPPSMWEPQQPMQYPAASQGYNAPYNPNAYAQPHYADPNAQQFADPNADTQPAQDPNAYAQPAQAFDFNAYPQPPYVQPQYDPNTYQHPYPAQPGYDPNAFTQPPQGYPLYPQQGYPQQNYQHGYAQPPHDPAAAAKLLRDTSSKKKQSKRSISNADATVGSSARVRFIRLTYVHLLGAILTFAGLLYLLMTNELLVTNISIRLTSFAIGGRWNWGVVLAAFMVVSWVADYWASHAKSRGMQYAGLGLYIVAEALIFVPLLAIVQWKTQEILARGGGEPNIIRDSAFVTLGIFTALTASVFFSKKDFSFLRSGLVMASGAALSLIVMSLVFGFNLGLVFSVAMVLLAAGYVLYQTSQVLAHYDPHQHVAASLALFSSVALMFWYVIRIFMRARD